MMPTSTGRETMILLLGVIFFFGLATWLAGSQFPDQGSNLCPLQWKHGVLTGPPGNSRE